MNVTTKTQRIFTIKLDEEEAKEIAKARVFLQGLMKCGPTCFVHRSEYEGVREATNLVENIAFMLGSEP